MVAHLGLCDYVAQTGRGPTHQALLEPLLYVGSCGARDLAQEGCFLLRMLQHLQGQPQVLNEMEHWEGFLVGGGGGQSRLTGTIINIRTCFSAWNERGVGILVRRVNVMDRKLVKSKGSERKGVRDG